MAYGARARTDSIGQSGWLHWWGRIGNGVIVPRSIYGVANGCRRSGVVKDGGTPSDVLALT